MEIQKRPWNFRNWRPQFGNLSHSEGFLQIPLGMALIILFILGFGVWGLLRNWRFITETQLRLDQCVGKMAFEYRDTLNSLAATNQRIHQLRAAIAASTLAAPGITAGLQAGLKGLVLKQELELRLWEFKGAQWLIKSCGKSGDFPFPLPKLQGVRPPMDAIGEQALEKYVQDPSSFRIQVFHSSRASAAQVKGGSIGSLVEVKKWKAEWVAPELYSGTSFP